MEATFCKNLLSSKWLYVREVVERLIGLGFQRRRRIHSSSHCDSNDSFKK